VGIEPWQARLVTELTSEDGNHDSVFDEDGWSEILITDQQESCMLLFVSISFPRLTVQPRMESKLPPVLSNKSDLCGEFTKIMLLLRFLNLIKEDYHAPNFEVSRSVPKGYPQIPHPLEAANSILVMARNVISVSYRSQASLQIIPKNASRTDVDASFESSANAIESAFIEDACLPFDTCFPFEDTWLPLEGTRLTVEDTHSPFEGDNSSVKEEDTHFLVKAHNASVNKDTTFLNPPHFIEFANLNDRHRRTKRNWIFQDLKVIDLAEAVDYWPNIQKHEFHCLSMCVFHPSQ